MGVSPAHAGIDQTGVAPIPMTYCLPRPRGDRPSKARMMSGSMTSPPPTRGSTQSLHAPSGAAAVSPAHAGIDPSPTPTRRRSWCLPRPRGDRPRRAWAKSEARKSPPPTRGSTVGEGLQLGQGLVSPAHAGIDLPGVAVERLAGCLPRPRGDRPSSTRQPRRASWSPPPTRGSTPSERFLAAGDIVSPAHAGIDLATMSAIPNTVCLPRPRGDRPLARA